MPCKSVAEELGLRVHQRETFTKWEASYACNMSMIWKIEWACANLECFQLPEGINLIVVVSFGLFVPPRIIRASKYGGLNVHPSFLPE